MDIDDLDPLEQRLATVWEYCMRVNEFTLGSVCTNMTSHDFTGARLRVGRGNFLNGCVSLGATPVDVVEAIYNHDLSRQKQTISATPDQPSVYDRPETALCNITQAVN